VITGLWTSEAGLAIQGLRLDAVADDVANEATPGFKAELVSAVSGPPQYGPLGSVSFGGGAAVAAVTRDWRQGPLQASGRTWDLAVQGPGFFSVRLADGTVAYTRAGDFMLDAQGTLVDQAGDPVLSTAGTPITVPPSPDGQAPVVRGDGTILVGGKAVAQLGLAAFTNPDGLLPGPNGTWLPGATAGAPQTTGTLGTVRQGFLEVSNTDMAAALTEMLDAARSFQFNAAAAAAAGRMWQVANQVHA
jgi:flagellar basal-body rod protein FlgG